MAAGVGTNPGVISPTVSSFIQRCIALKYDGAMLRQWFDNISADPDQNVAAQALVDAATADGFTITLDDAKVYVAAVRDGTYWTATLAPSAAMLKVAGPQT